MNSWRELLAHVVEKLYGAGRLTVEDVPIKRSDNRFMVHTEPVHPTGEAFRSYRRIEGSPPLFVHVQMSASSARSRTRWLLKQYGVDPGTVRLQLV